MDGFCIDVPKEKRHGAALLEGLGGDVVSFKTQLLSHVGSCGPGCLSEVRYGDIFPPIPHSGSAQWDVRRCAMGS